MEHPKDIGYRSTLAIITVLRELGYGVYLPFGENTRCDLILERGAADYEIGPVAIGGLRASSGA